MAAAARRRKGGHHEEEHENEERWLVSFADMMTLLFCLFMVLFAISSVNTSKLEILQKALQEAFSGQIMPGGKAAIESGAGAERMQAPQPPTPALTLSEALGEEMQVTEAPASKSGAAASYAAEAAAAAAAREDEDFRRLKHKIDRLVKQAGLRGRVRVAVRRRGLMVELLTDKVFFDSGRAELKPRALPLLAGLADVLREEERHPIVVEGHTDAQPVRGGPYPSNWELSGARAGSVLRTIQGRGVPTSRLTLSGFADQEPVGDNATAEGRARNRRVAIVLTRLNRTPSSAGRRP